MQQSYAMATHGDDILRSARTFPTLRDALADAIYVFGATARSRRWRDALEPRDFAAGAVTHAHSGQRGHRVRA